MHFQRSGGILLHIISLPSPFGIGSLGKEAFEFVDFLQNAGQKYWQIFPLGTTGYGDSPYQTFSAFAGNPLLIDIPELIKKKLLSKNVLALDEGFSDKIDYNKVIKVKEKLFRLAFTRFIPNEDYYSFCKKESFWLDDYALFMSIRREFSEISWSNWDESIKLRKEEALKHYKMLLKDDIHYQKFLQYEFFSQWNELHKYATDKRVEIIGDLPIFVGFDSADTWSKPDLFFLDEQKNPTKVAGVPPDGFSETGQLWGNPLYNWDAMEQDGFDWWIKRFSSVLNIVDVVRLDHFIGFVNYWAVPAADKTAEKGKWEIAKGDKLFEILQHKMGDLPIIAEDLGALTPEVSQLRDKYNFPGMKVLQFAFYDGMKGSFLPHNFTDNFVVYTGTHDNETTRGWYKNLPESVKSFADEYLNFSGNESEISSVLIKAAWQSKAKISIAPMQDFLNLDNKSRMNSPGTISDNWQWKMRKDQLTPALAQRLRDLANQFDRLSSS